MQQAIISGEGSNPFTMQSGRLEVVVPDETLMAGQDNAVSFVLRNPFAIPVGHSQSAPSSVTADPSISDGLFSGMTTDTPDT